MSKIEIDLELVLQAITNGTWKSISVELATFLQQHEQHDKLFHIEFGTSPCSPVLFYPVQAWVIEQCYRADRAERVKNYKHDFSQHQHQPSIVKPDNTASTLKRRISKVKDPIAQAILKNILKDL